MSEEKFSFANIVATPAQSSWSQAYNAGKLFAVLSLIASTAETEENPLSLATNGKEILKTLEEEYFTLEEKNLDSIKNAVSLCLEKVAEDLTPSLAVCAIVNEILYVFLYGQGKVLLKREQKFGSVIKTSEEETKLVCASGFLENGDIIILETKRFSELVSSFDWQDVLDHQGPQEIVETLSPKIHEKAHGDASAIIISFKKEASAKPSEALIDEIAEEQLPQNKLSLGFLLQKTGFLINRLSFLKRALKALPISLSRSHMIILSVAVILILLLSFSIYTAIKKQEESKRQAFFTEIYPQAQKKFDEGNALSSLNKNLARDDYTAAQKILQENQSKFAADSTERKRIEELLGKVNQALEQSTGSFFLDVKETDPKNSLLLSTLSKNKQALFATTDEKSIYFADNEKVISLDKKSGQDKTIITNKNLWKEIGGIGVFGSNFYVLDKKSDQIYKFAGFSGESKSNYLLGAVDLSKAGALAIDGAVYVLIKDGVILKFTKGKPESFKLTGLDKPFSSPSRIFTDRDTNNLYVLDNNNSRIVVLSKEGNYISQYSASLIKNAQDFDVLESAKKAYVLSQGKIFEMNLK